MALILDYLLPASYTQGTSATQVAKLARVFLQTLASTALPNDALTVFVNEFKSSFSRALSLPESLVKHQRIRAITSLLGQIVEPQTQTGFSSRSTVNPTQFVRMLIRRGFITDLSKAIHSLDLNSTLMTTTVNSILKPLEYLTKIVTQFLAAQKKTQVSVSAPANISSVTRNVPSSSTQNPITVPPTQRSEGSGNITVTTASTDNVGVTTNTEGPVEVTVNIDLNTGESQTNSKKYM